MLTLQIKEEIHDFFACDAAGLSLALYIPEVYAREQMMKLPSFQARSTHIARIWPSNILPLCSPCCRSGTRTVKWSAATCFAQAANKHVRAD